MSEHHLAVSMGRVIHSRVLNHTKNKDVLELTKTICQGLVEECWDNEKCLKPFDVKNITIEEAALIYLNSYLPFDWEIARDIKKLSIFERLLGRRDISRYKRAVLALRAIAEQELVFQREKKHAREID